MAGETSVTIVGNLVAPPELRFINSGTAVANFTVASTPRTFKDGEWKDGDPLFMRCNIWRDAAENVTESLNKGDRVIVTGYLKQRSWEDKNGGGKRSAIELEVEEIGPSLKFATAKVTRGQAKQSSGGGGQWSNTPKDDPWGSNDSEPPF